MPESTRVALPLVTEAREAEILRGPRRTPAIMLFLLGLVATLVTAFTVDNTRRRPAVVEAESDRLESADGILVAHAEPEENERSHAAAAMVDRDSGRPELVQVDPAEPGAAQEQGTVSADALEGQSRRPELVQVDPAEPATAEQQDAAAAADLEGQSRRPELVQVEPLEPAVAEEQRPASTRRPRDARGRFAPARQASNE